MHCGRTCVHRLLSSFCCWCVHCNVTCVRGCQINVQINTEFSLVFYISYLLAACNRCGPFISAVSLLEGGNLNLFIKCAGLGKHIV